MIEAIILGSGTSNGVPMLGAHYPDAYLANPKNHRTRASLLIKGPTGNLLVDCPPELRIQCVRESVFDIDAVIITHTHADHVMGMDDLRSICMKTGQPVDVYTLPPYQDDIRRIFPYAFAEFPPGVVVPRFDLYDCPAELNVCGLRISTFLVDHGKTKVIGLRVEDFAYITDVNRIPPESRAQLDGLETLVIDAVRYAPHPNHFHMDQALEVAAEIGAARTILTHLSSDYDHDITNAEMPEGVELAFDGLRIAISEH